MGIKYYFVWFKQNFYKQIEKLKKHETIDGIDNLLIDMNGLFHNSAQQVYKYGNFKENKSMLRKLKTPQPSKTRLQMFQHVAQTIEELLSITNPKLRLIMSVDGPVPLGKSLQQRERRFRSGMERMESTEENVFDSSCISTGTEFMYFLTKYVDWYIRKQISTNERWKNLEVIFSNERTVGEGEHKAINYVRKYGDPDEVYCIHGLDADLIMLSLSTLMPNFYIIRDDIYDPTNDYFLINIGETQVKLIEMLRWENVNNKHVFETNRCIYDYLLISFLIGNDFLPHIPSIDILQGSIDLFIDMYKEVCKEYGHLTYIENGKVYFVKSSLQAFLRSIASFEKTMFDKKLNSKEIFFTDELLKKHTKIMENGVVDVDITSYREEYMKTLFGNETEESLCHQYLEGMQWVLNYYTTGPTSWNWFYRHHHSPFAYHMSKHIETYEVVMYKYSCASVPFKQLLSILHPISSNLLPKPLSNLLTDPESPLIPFCPLRPEIDLSGKKREWEGKTLVPLIDRKILDEVYDKNVHKVEDKELVRNKHCFTNRYMFNPMKPSVFKSYYGDINTCVSVDTLDI